MKQKRQIKQGEIYMVSLNDTIGSEQNGVRPCLIVQNDIGNEYSPTTIILPITSKKKTILPTHYILLKNDYPLLSFEKNIILVEQIRCVDKKRLERKVCSIDNKDMVNIIKIIEENFKI